MLQMFQIDSMISLLSPQISIDTADSQHINKLFVTSSPCSRLAKEIWTCPDKSIDLLTPYFQLDVFELSSQLTCLFHIFYFIFGPRCVWVIENSFRKMLFLFDFWLNFFVTFFLSFPGIDWNKNFSFKDLNLSKETRTARCARSRVKISRKK